MTFDLPNANDLAKNNRQAARKKQLEERAAWEQRKAERDAQPRQQRAELTDEEIETEAIKFWNELAPKLAEYWRGAALLLPANGYSKKTIEFASENYFEPRNYKVTKVWDASEKAQYAKFVAI
jgi:hypothetical protein